MARSIWTGVITFGLASLPVGLYTATEDHTVHFHELQHGTADRIRTRRVNERTGREVPSENIVKGYEFAGGEYIVVEPDELDQIAPGRSQAIDITDFVDLADIEPVYFDRTYYVAPRGKEYTKVYELLRAALEESDKAGGQEIAVAEEAPQATNVIDLMSVLQGSLDQARGKKTAAEPRQTKKKAPARTTARRPAVKAAKRPAAHKAPPKTTRTASKA